MLPKLPYVGGVGRSAVDNYWSSSQNDANNAWDQNFSNGSQNSNNKNNTNCVGLSGVFNTAPDVHRLPSVG